MSSSEASSPSAESVTHDTLPPLSDGAREEFVGLFRNYCVLLPKCDDTDDFHLDTVRLSAAVDVCFSFTLQILMTYSVFPDLVYQELLVLQGLGARAAEI